MRQIIENYNVRGSSIRLVQDPHDGSGKDRWFVESQLRFDDEQSARAALQNVFATLSAPAPRDKSE